MNGHRWDRCAGSRPSADSDLGDGRACICLNHEEQPFVAFAALEGGRAGWSWLFPDLCSSNGERYGVHLFGSLPTETENYVPALLPESVIRDGYRRWLDNEEEGWWWFEESLVPDAAHAAHSSPTERLLARSDVDVEAIIKAKPLPNSAFDASRRELVIDLYFSHCYSQSAGR